MLLIKKTNSLIEFVKEKIKNEVFSVKGLPFGMAIVVLAVLFVLFRMKSVELDYKISDLNRMIEDSTAENKDLKATKAKLLSAGNIRVFAKKHNLSQPKQEQIIVIP